MSGDGESDQSIEADAAAAVRTRTAETPTIGGTVELDDTSLYLNRELSELAFQRRVLHEAIDDRNPLLYRLAFLGLVTRNLDEFFMKRVGGLNQQIDAGVTETTPDGRTPREQWRAIMTEAQALFREQSECYREELRPALAEEGVHIPDHHDLSDAEQAALRTHFERSILPTLTPLTFDPAHPFPFISNRSLSLGILTRHDGDAPEFSRVKIPPNRPRLIDVDEVSGDIDGNGGSTSPAGSGAGGEFGVQRYIRLEELVAANLDLLFPNIEILGHALFRVTRNAEVRRNEAVAEDLIEMIEEVLRERRFATVVRLEIQPDAPDRVRDTLVEELGLSPSEVVEVPGPIDYRGFTDLAERIDRPDLKRSPWTPKPHPALPDSGDDRSVFDAIRDRDVLVHHPYHSFEDTVQRFLDAAAHDPDVLAIKIAIYRTASDSSVIQSLVEAARNDKQVAAMVELKARFDEERNLEWVDRLEEEGIHVAYGVPGYKTHTKTALVVREEADGVRLYSHVGTGNYHSETAKTYEDLGLLTADPDIGHDLTTVFNYFTGGGLDDDLRELLVAPINLRESLTAKIRREADIAREGGHGRITLKANRLEDPTLVRELYEASRAGVEIDCIVRDICRLRPGVEGVSETIDVYSVVGRFLEHSRIFRFRNDGEPEYFIGSPDWMTRNLDNRVEAVTPVAREAHRRYLDWFLDTIRDDNRTCWEMQPDGTYVQRQPGGEEARATHDVLMRRARTAAIPTW